MINIGIIGCGYWGPNLIRNFTQIKNCRLISVCDIDKNKIKKIKKIYPYLKCFFDYKEMIDESEIDAVVVSTPPQTHYQISYYALSKNKHVFIEKPMCLNSKDSKKLIQIANKNNLIILTGHTFIYSPSVQKIHEIIKNGDIGEILYIDSVRINLGLFQTNTNVLWDLAPHDISIINYILNKLPYKIRVEGITYYGKHENMAYISLYYPENIISHINVSWISPVKIRWTIIGGTNKMIVYNDLEESEKVKIYDRAILTHFDKQKEDKVKIEYRLGDIYIPHLLTTEPLFIECSDFIFSIIKKTPPLSDGKFGHYIVKILEAGQESINSGGKEIEINYN